MADDLLTALALVLVIEGALYALFPEAMRRIIFQVMELETSTIRTIGLSAAVIGVGLVWLLRG